MIREILLGKLRYSAVALGLIFATSAEAFAGVWLKLVSAATILSSMANTFSARSERSVYARSCKEETVARLKELWKDRMNLVVVVFNLIRSEVIPVVR